MKNESLHLRLTIDVWYDTHGVMRETLEHLLRRISELAADEGRLSDDTEAEVSEWHAKVEHIA